MYFCDNFLIFYIKSEALLIGTYNTRVLLGNEKKIRIITKYSSITSPHVTIVYFQILTSVTVIMDVVRSVKTALAASGVPVELALDLI